MYKIKHDTIIKFSEENNAQLWELRNYDINIIWLWAS